MSYKIVWSPEASQSYSETVESFINRGGKQKAKRIREQVLKMEGLLRQFPFLYTEVEPGLRRGLIIEEVSLYHEIKGKEVHVLLVWDNRRDPEKRPL